MLNSAIKNSIINLESLSSFFTREKKNDSVLFENELILSRKFSEKRNIDFSTGRYCARKALDQLNLDSVEILIGVNREPLWPEGIVGSISHCDSLIGAIVAKIENYTSIGLDIEEIGKIEKSLWSLLFTKSEISFLSGLSVKDCGLFSTVFFSMKESFYKLQYPLTNMFLDFKDVEIEFYLDEYYLTIINTNSSFKFLSPIKIEYKICNNCVITYCVIAKGD
jgi:4'-phosphopantetheinyl transferase EntD